MSAVVPCVNHECDCNHKWRHSGILHIHGVCIGDFKYLLGYFAYFLTVLEYVEVECESAAPYHKVSEFFAGYLVPFEKYNGQRSLDFCDKFLPAHNIISREKTEKPTLYKIYLLSVRVIEIKFFCKGKYFALHKKHIVAVVVFYIKAVPDCKILLLQMKSCHFFTSQIYFYPTARGFPAS